MGSDETNSVFRIAHPLGFSGAVTLDLDRIYDGSPALKKPSKLDYRFTVPTKLASKSEPRVKDAEPCLLPLPPADKPVQRTAIDSKGKPPPLKMGSLGPVTWTGTALESIKSARLYANT